MFVIEIEVLGDLMLVGFRNLEEKGKVVFYKNGGGMYLWVFGEREDKRMKEV